MSHEERTGRDCEVFAMSDRIQQIRERMLQIAELCGHPVGEHRCNLPKNHPNQDSHEWHCKRPTIEYPDVEDIAHLLERLGEAEKLLREGGGPLTPETDGWLDRVAAFLNREER